MPVPPPIHVVVTRVAATPYLYRLRRAYDGVDPEAFTITNAELLLLTGPLGMALGPLRELWDIAGLTLAQAIDRCLEGPRVRVCQIAELLPPSLAVPIFGVGVSVDGAGRPQLEVQFPIKDFPITGLSSLEFRHSTGR